MPTYPFHDPSQPRDSRQQGAGPVQSRQEYFYDARRPASGQTQQLYQQSAASPTSSDSSSASSASLGSPYATSPALSGHSPLTTYTTPQTPSHPSSRTTAHPQQHHGYICMYPTSTTCKRPLFARKADLQRHYQTVHTPHQIEHFDCHICHRRDGYGFTRKDKLIDHLREVHGSPIAKKGGRGGGKG